jgi:hypothetical protein
MRNNLVARIKLTFLLLFRVISTPITHFYHVFSLKGCAHTSSAWKLHLRKGAASLFCDKQQRKKNATITLLALLLLLITPICLATGNIILDKSIYGLDETVKISLINITADDTLSIISDKDVFKYSGELKSELEFYPKEVGNYTVRLSNGEIIDEASFSVIEGYVHQNSSLLVYTDKKDYSVNEPVLVHINATGEYELAIISEKEVFKYLGMVQNPLTFIPQASGNYKVELRKDFVPVATTEFNVVEQTLNQGVQDINIIPQVTPPTTSQEIVFSSTPKTAEEETGAEAETNENLLNITLPFKLDIKDKNGLSKNLGVRVLRAAGDEYDVELLPGKAGVRNIRLNNLKIVADKNIKFDEIALKRAEVKKEFKERRVIRSFFIDASELNFTNGTITSIAAGNELWKCKEWNSTQNSCLGSWNKIMDLTPGTAYEIPITPEDPAYTETGVASINTRKPIYHPGETANMIMVVLDTAGHLVNNADVSLTITAPDNTITTLLTTSNGEIIETSRGIYETNYIGTATEGSYDMFVSAQADHVNNSMHSSFEVKSFYEFDILRDIPVTTDPWQGAFSSNIRIISYTDATNENTFNFTEILPDNFEIISSSGARITNSNNKTYLTWTNLNNNSVVTYSTKPPLISPELYELGPSFVNYDASVFYEARPWYLAVDPYRTDLLPDGDGALTGWSIAGSTPAATRWQSVDDPVGSPDNATTYIASPASVAGNSFTFQNLSDQGVVVNWVAVRVYARRAAATSAMGIFYRQGGTDYNNTVANQTLTSTWALYSPAGWNYTTNPANGLAWNESTISNMEWGVRRTSGTQSAWVTQMYITVGYNITNNPPNVTALNYPGNMSNVTTSTVQFNFTVTDDRGFGNCTLYTNVTGAWIANKTDTTIINNSLNNITVTMPDGNYLWNILCWDNISPPLSDWYDYNYTIHIDTTGPNTTIDRPSNFTNITTNSYTLNATITDLIGIDTLTFRYRQNASDTWHYACNDNRGPIYDCIWDVTTLPDGKDYQILAYANDTFGNLGNNDTHTNITIDRTGPNTTLERPYNFANITTNTTKLNATATDITGIRNVSFYYRLNESDTWKYACYDNTGPEYNCTWNITLLPDGKDYQILAYANDTFGTIGNNDTHTNITIDRTGPNTILDYPANFTNITTNTYMLNATATDLTGVHTVTFLYRQNASAVWNYACNDSRGPTYDCTWDLTSLTDGKNYQIRAYANDTFGTRGNNDTHTNITIDRASPNTTLNTPLNQSQYNSTVNFTYRVNDTTSNVSNCSLIINNEVIHTNYSIPEGSLQYFIYRIPLAGWYDWSINCTDALGNINASVTRALYIIRPDLKITSGNMSFNNTTPKEGEGITINATLFNRGGSDALNATIQFFLGDPDTGGVQINENFTANITERTGATPNITLNTSWVVTGPGPFNFYIVADPPIATNGSINETNETNNEANKTLNVAAYNYFYGYVENNVFIASSLNQSFYYYNNITNVTGNIFVVDQGSTVSFSALQAIRRDINNNTANNDFNDTDAALGMTGYNDSIRKIYTNNTDVPRTVRDMTVFNKRINNVPIVNSTNVSRFVTGMLWDMSDGGTQYGGTQDLVFITQINASKQGAYGAYDYEIKVPAKIRDYHGAGTQVDFYWEITGFIG